MVQIFCMVNGKNILYLPNFITTKYIIKRKLIVAESTLIEITVESPDFLLMPHCFQDECSITSQKNLANNCVMITYFQQQKCLSLEKVMKLHLLSEDALISFLNLTTAIPLTSQSKVLLSLHITPSRFPVRLRLKGIISLLRKSQLLGLSSSVLLCTWEGQTRCKQVVFKKTCCQEPVVLTKVQKRGVRQQEQIYLWYLLK